VTQVQQPGPALPAARDATDQCRRSRVTDRLGVRFWPGRDRRATAVERSGEGSEPQGRPRPSTTPTRR
jgi:hypothetical protein